MVNITCGLDNPTKWQHACHDIVAKILLRNENSQLNIVCNGKEGCYEGIFNIDTMLSNDIINSESQIHIECIGEKSCYKGAFAITGINNVNISCEYAYACYHMALTSITLNELPSGTLTANCISGYEVCKCLIVNGVSMESISVTCPYAGDTDQYECWGLQVYCPINPFGMISDNENNNQYLDINSVNENTCYVDLGFTGNKAEVYAIFGISQTRILNTNAWGDSEIWCELDWFNRIIWTFNDTNDDDYCINNEITKDKINKISNGELSLITNDAHSSVVSCPNNNIDCIIYISPQLTKLNDIKCPIGANECSVVWYVVI